MALQGVLGNGSKVGYSGASPVTYLKIAQLMNIDEFLQLVPDDVDTTVMGTSSIRTTMNGLTANPTCSITLLADLDPATAPSQEAMRQYSAGSGHANEGATIYLRIEVPVNRAQSSFRAWEFQAVVKEFNLSAPIDDKQTIKLTFRYAGGYVVSPAATSSIIS